jgi:hypothetical protein
MKMIMAALAVASATALAACQTDEIYDGVSRFADTGYWDRYYGPGSPPHDG